MGLIVAAALLDGMRLNGTGFSTALVVFTIAFALVMVAAFVLPFLGLEKHLERRV